MDNCHGRGYGPAEKGELAVLVDPMHTAINHNKESSPLHKLPDEILLIILHFLNTEIQSIFSLRRVCRRLRCLVDDKTVGSRDLWVRRRRPRAVSLDKHLLHPDRFTVKENTRFNARWSRAHVYAMQGFDATIRKQTLCGPCHAAYQENMLPDGCIFGERPEKLTHCGGCGTHHPVHAFSHFQRRRRPEKRICVGREGELRLCEHVSIKWADIEAHLVASQKRSNFYQAVMEFHVVCKDPSHNFPCQSTPHVAPSKTSCNDRTRPCARLDFYPQEPSIAERDPYYTNLWLIMCWKPFSSTFKRVTAPENGKLEATRLRELFREYGKDAARYIVPGPSQTPLPEMLCFDPDKCGHVLYRNGAVPVSRGTLDERLCTPHFTSETGSVGQSESDIDMDRDHSSCFSWRRTEHYVEFDEARGQSGIYVYECEEQHHGNDPTRCLMTSYRRTIPLGHLEHPGRVARNPHQPWRVRLNPSHEWFHAIDQDSYPSIEASGFWSKMLSCLRLDGTKSRPRCRDTACRNYYQSPGPLHEKNMHGGCDRVLLLRECQCTTVWDRWKERMGIAFLELVISLFFSILEEALYHR